MKNSPPKIKNYREKIENFAPIFSYAALFVATA